MIRSEYPYYIVPAVEKLKAGNLSETEAMECKRFIAANVGDEAALRILLGLNPEGFSKFYPDMSLPSPSTSETIDSFLSKFGHRASLQSNAIPEIAVPPALSAEPQATAGIDDAKALPTVSELIKKHDYQGALETIKRLSLNNPEKSVYFADQIRFLRKLMLNQAHSNNKNG